MFDADRTLGANRWPIVRVRSGGQTEVTLLSTRFFAISTHWNRCTLPCCGENCRLCELLPVRGLFSCAVMCNSRVSILELGSQSASYLEQHAKLLHGGMRPGLVFRLARSGQKRPVSSEVIREVTTCREVPLLELASHVMAVYKYPPPNPDEAMESYERRCRAVAKIRCDRAADLLLNARSQGAAR